MTLNDFGKARQIFNQELISTLIAEVEKMCESSAPYLAGETTPNETKLGQGYRIALQEVSSLLKSHLPTGDKEAKIQKCVYCDAPCDYGLCCEPCGKTEDRALGKID